MEGKRTWPRWVVWGLGPAVAILIILVGMAPVLPYLGRAFAEAAPHAPNWALWRELNPQTQIHIFAALTALVLGFVILGLPKGRGLHKPIGWAWVAAMAVTAISSLFMTGLNGNSYSLIHLLTGWTLIALPMGVFAIRNRNVIAHRRAMTGMFLGGLLVAGAFTFLPGRFMFELFF
jgi:uncharacterized membrane protein